MYHFIQTCIGKINVLKHKYFMRVTNKAVRDKNNETRLTSLLENIPMVRTRVINQNVMVDTWPYTFQQKFFFFYTLPKVQSSQQRHQGFRNTILVYQWQTLVVPLSWNFIFNQILVISWESVGGLIKFLFKECSLEIPLSYR